MRENYRNLKEVLMWDLRQALNLKSLSLGIFWIKDLDAEGV
jgi:hypothetical protein